MRKTGISNHTSLFARCRRGAPWFLVRHTPRWPRGVDLELTDRCNLDCANCWLHGTNGIGEHYGAVELDTSEILKFIARLPRNGPALYFGGGEPLLRHDLPTIAAYANRRGLTTAFTTNGTLLTEEMGRRLLEADVRQMNVSIDGPEEVHDRLRGSGAYQTVLSNIKTFLAEKKAAGKRLPLVTVKLTVNPALVGRFEEAIARLREATADSVDAYTIHHLWFITPRELEHHQSEVRQALGCSSKGAAGHLCEQTTQIDVRALAAEIELLRRTPRVRFYPDFDGEELVEYYAEQRESGRKCRSPWRALLVKPNGDVRFCPDEWIDGYRLGSIVQNDIRDIWTGAQAARFRQVLAMRGSFPGCKRCSWLT